MSTVTNPEDEQQQQPPFDYDEEPDLTGLNGDFQEHEVSNAQIQQQQPLPEPVQELVPYKPYHADLADENGNDEYSSCDEEEEEEEGEDQKEGAMQDDDTSPPRSPSVKSRRPVAKNFCYLCDHGQHVANIEVNVYHQMLLQLIEETYHQRSLKRYVRDVQRYYNAAVRGFVELPASHPNHCLLIWKKKMIVEHVDKHVYNTTIQRADEVMTYREMQTTLRDNDIFLRNTRTGAKSLNASAARLYMQISKARAQAERQLHRPNNTI